MLGLLQMNKYLKCFKIYFSFGKSKWYRIYVLQLLIILSKVEYSFSKENIACCSVYFKENELLDNDVYIVLIFTLQYKFHYSLAVQCSLWEPDVPGSNPSQCKIILFLQFNFYQFFLNITLTVSYLPIHE